MPSKNPAQARFMAMCAHAQNLPEHCPPRSVATEFNQSDKGTGILSGPRKKKRKRGATY